VYLYGKASESLVLNTGEVPATASWLLPAASDGDGINASTRLRFWTAAVIKLDFRLFFR